MMNMLLNTASSKKQHDADSQNQPSGITCDRHSVAVSVSCVIPVFNEAENLRTLVTGLYACLQKMTNSMEIIFIDDGSQDNTYALAAELANEYPIKVLQFSRNFGKEAAMTAGLEHASGDVVILMDGDGQHSTDILPIFLQQWRNGYDMVYGLRSGRAAEPLWKRKMSNWFYSLMQSAASVPIVPDAGDFRLMDRRVVNALNQLPERARFMKGLYAWVGFKSIGCTYEVKERNAGKSSFNFKKLTQLALTGIVSFSDIPLRVWGGIGALISILAILNGLYILVSTLFFGIDLPGWATITVSISFLGGIQLLSIGVLGEYIGRIFNEVKRRPIYLVANKIGFNDKP
jgi:glycosyltransferase involved in cell wall biosynthesis